MLKIVDMKGKPKLRREAAELYAEIFKEKPWSENFRPEEVMIRMGEQCDGISPSIMLASVKYGFKRRKVVGFSWLYEIFQDDLKEGTRYSPELKFLFGGKKRVFYFQEVGTKKEYRRKGIGEKVIRKILKKAKRAGANSIVLSTNSNAKAARALFSKVGFKDSGIVRPATTPKELDRTYWILELEN